MSETTLRKRENTRARLIEAAGEVFLLKGFAGAKIDDVVKAAGFTRGAFYSNFSSMEDLLHEVIVTQADDILAHLRTAIDAAPESMGVDELIAILEAIRPAGRSMYILVSEVMLYQLRNPNNEIGVAGEYERIKAEVAALLTKMLAHIGRPPTVPIEAASSVLIFSFLGVIAQAELDGESGQGGDVLDPFVRAVVDAVSVEP